MATQTDFVNLYALQDSVLQSMLESETVFYLTGGTCLHRFIACRRYSEDLDFFCPDPNLFRDQARAFLLTLESSGHSRSLITDSRDFIRILYAKTLKIDLVNDRVIHQGPIELTPQGYRIDNIHNILSNKITAVVSRDEPKDVFDLITISETISIDWVLAIQLAREKALFEPDYFIYRLETFPPDLLDLLNLTEARFLSEAKTLLPALTADVKSQL